MKRHYRHGWHSVTWIVVVVGRLLLLLFCAATSSTTTSVVSAAGDRAPTSNKKTNSRCEKGTNPPLEKAIGKLREEQGLYGGLAVGFTTTQGYFYTTAQGPEDHEGKIPVDPDVTLFRWASVSKSLVGVVAAFLEDEGLIDVDLDISEYYPDYHRPDQYLTCWNGDPAGSRQFSHSNWRCRFRKKIPKDKGTGITLRQLLGHRGGIQHYNNGVVFDPSPNPKRTIDPTINTGMEWALPNFINAPLVDIPGTIPSYSTFGFNLAAVVLEHATQTPYGQLIQHYVTGPLQLCSLQPDYEWDSVPHRAAGFDGWGHDTGSDDVSWKLGGGGIRSTTNDFARYAKALLQNTTWMPQSVHDKIFLPHPDYYLEEGCFYHFGLEQCYDDNLKLLTASHAGAQQKTQTFLLLNFQDDNDDNSKEALVVMTNAENIDMNTALNTFSSIFSHELPLTSDDSCMDFSNVTCDADIEEVEVGPMMQ